jgi:hypothetical protein
MLYIGIDLGTSAVKLLLMDGEGKILKITAREYPLSIPHPGWSEQDPEDWLRETVAGIRELTDGFDRAQVAGIGVGGQMHASWFSTKTIVCCAPPSCGTTAVRRRKRSTSIRPSAEIRSRGSPPTSHSPASQRPNSSG